jgi:hypothetical protein
MIDFNDAEPQIEFDLIPTNTIAKARLTIKSGDDFSTPGLTKSKNGDSAYINCEYVIMEGPYTKRRVFDKIGVRGSDMWVMMGRSRIRAILESAKNIDPKDSSDAALQARHIELYSELDGLEPLIKIGIETDRSGVYQNKNKVLSIITPDKQIYKTYMTTYDMPWDV